LQIKGYLYKGCANRSPGGECEMVDALGLDKMGLDELKKLAKEIKKAIREAEKAQMREARVAAEEAVKKFGLSLDAIVKHGAKFHTGAASSSPRCSLASARSRSSPRPTTKASSGASWATGASGV
jgi:hypothetical protein